MAQCVCVWLYSILLCVLCHSIHFSVVQWPTHSPLLCDLHSYISIVYSVLTVHCYLWYYPSLFYYLLCCVLYFSDYSIVLFIIVLLLFCYSHFILSYLFIDTFMLTHFLHSLFWFIPHFISRILSIVCSIYCVLNIILIIQYCVCVSYCQCVLCVLNVFYSIVPIVILLFVPSDCWLHSFIVSFDWLESRVVLIYSPTHPKCVCDYCLFYCVYSVMCVFIVSYSLFSCVYSLCLVFIVILMMMCYFSQLFMFDTFVCCCCCTFCIIHCYSYC